MAVGATAVWLIVMGLGIYALVWPGKASPRTAAFYLIGGGTLFPTIVLAALLMVGLSLLPAQLAPAPPGSLRIDIVGYQWWWQVRYPQSGGDIRLANEIHLPAGEPVEFHLTSEDVIHSFWIPSLGGKVDMIPGRQTRLTLYPTRTGRFRGACAEFCGASHALMSFDVVVQERADFADWLAEQSQPALEPKSTMTRRGQQVFLNNGCGACHTVRGTPANGEIGPDLTHVGGRLSLAAGILHNDPAGFRKWLEHPKSVKPGAHMPLFGMLPSDDLHALAVYLDSLQ
jgi:cytochrome c oxidase subunit 2